MTTAGSGSSAGDVEALARQYFSAWGDALRHAAAPPGQAAGPEGQGNWQQAIDWWGADDAQRRQWAGRRGRAPFP